jgi:hypothetical protein
MSQSNTAAKSTSLQYWLGTLHQILVVLEAEQYMSPLFSRPLQPVTVPTTIFTQTLTIYGIVTQKQGDAYKTAICFWLDDTKTPTNTQRHMKHKPKIIRHYGKTWKQEHFHSCVIDSPNLPRDTRVKSTHVAWPLQQWVSWRGSTKKDDTRTGNKISESWKCLCERNPHRAT